jgi:UDP-N-acetylmuramoyl-tripeptide--D-alanyl-D-alanine ligase
MGMVEPLWTFDALVTAAQGAADGPPPVSVGGFSIDTRSLLPGEVFVALKDQRDGHDFVPAAFGRGAAAAIVGHDYARRPGNGALIRVDEPLAALRRIGVAARARLSPDARVVAITGSAGKTGTTAMLRAALATAGPTHAPEKSFNNHWGVPLTLARMPAATRFAVFEIGMNHADEIRPLVRLVRPHIAVVTNVLPVHVGNFADGEVGVANAKAEIFEGLEGGGTGLVLRDSPHFDRLAAAVARQGARLATFGVAADADVRPVSLVLTADGSEVTLADGTHYRLSMPGQHIAMNSLAVAAVLDTLVRSGSRGIDKGIAMAAVAAVGAGPGRGQQSRLLIGAGNARFAPEILLIDESYNANPASMRAALAVLGRTATGPAGRRIAVMGDMRELGPDGPAMHVALADAVREADVDLVFACGPLMRGLFEAISASERGAWAELSTGLVAPLLAALSAGDVVMVKGSLGTNMAPIVAALKEQHRRNASKVDAP